MGGCRYAVDKQVAAKLRRIVNSDIDPRFHPGPTISGFFPVNKQIDLARGSVISGTTEEIIAPSIEWISMSWIESTAFSRTAVSSAVLFCSEAILDMKRSRSASYTPYYNI